MMHNSEVMAFLQARCLPLIQQAAQLVPLQYAELAVTARMSCFSPAWEEEQRSVEALLAGIAGRGKAIFLFQAEEAPGSMRCVLYLQPEKWPEEPVILLTPGGTLALTGDGQRLTLTLQE